MNFEIFIFCIVERFGFLIWLNAVSWSIFRIKNILKKIQYFFLSFKFSKVTK